MNHTANPYAPHVKTTSRRKQDAYPCLLPQHLSQHTVAAARAPTIGMRFPSFGLRSNRVALRGHEMHPKRPFPFPLSKWVQISEKRGVYLKGERFSIFSLLFPQIRTLILFFLCYGSFFWKKQKIGEGKTCFKKIIHIWTVFFSNYLNFGEWTLYLRKLFVLVSQFATRSNLSGGCSSSSPSSLRRKR